MKEQPLSVGDLAQLSGLTIRTLQYYDKINLLPASGKTESGRRFYTKEDIISLEQIMFYKNLGFSLSEIDEKLLNTSDLQEIYKMLSDQSMFVFRKMEVLHNISAVIEASQKIIELKKYPPWLLLVKFIKDLNENDVTAWDSYDFNQEQRSIFSEAFKSTDQMIGLYHTYKALLIKAAAFDAVGILPHEPVAQELARQWIDMANEAIRGNEEHLDAYLQVNQNRDNWPEGIRLLMEAADSFITECCKIYCSTMEDGVLSRLFK
jgi:MerR family transcriptional regulator, thiopeptide resistance regulator